MATVVPTIKPNSELPAPKGAILQASWALTTANADGRGVPVAGFKNFNWQGVAGTAGGATLAFEGSNDGTNWYPLTKVGGSTAATMTASGGAETNEHPLYVRPNLTTPGTGAVWTVTLVATA
jgi:hypothetical protein